MCIRDSNSFIAVVEVCTCIGFLNSFISNGMGVIFTASSKADDIVRLTRITAETYKPKFHCRRQSGMNFGYVDVYKRQIKDMADRVVKLRDGMIRKNYLNKHKIPAAELDW